MSSTEELSKVLEAIGGLNRAPNEAGHSYMGKKLADQANV
jgi:hypothetical protein